MKKIAMLIASALTAALSLPTVANAQNNYPTFPKPVLENEIDSLTDEEKAERTAMLETAEKEVCRAYQNGEYDWDFDLDGDVDVYDADHILKRYVELSVDDEFDSFDMFFWDDEHGIRIEEQDPFTAEMRAKVDENGDIDGSGYINAKDCVYMMIAIFSDKENGDVNTDGSLDARDASKMLSFYADNSVSIESDYATEKNMEYLGDLNGDGKVDSSDASAVLKAYSDNSVK